MKMNFRVAGGFSLVELLAVVAVVGILSSMGYVSYTGQRQAADANKLASDAAVVNRAVALYLASGGSLDGVTAPQEILDKLKADATAESAARRIGLNGTFLDARVKARVGNASGSQPRAVWNSGEHRFDVVTTGGSGVLEFMLDDAEATRAAGLEADARSTTKAAATDTAWIWDYSDPPAQTASRGGAVPAAGLITSAAMAAAGQGFTGGTSFPLTSLNMGTNESPFHQGQVASLGNNGYAIEDIPGGGDADYDDLIFTGHGLSESEGATFRDVDPTTYYPERLAALNRNYWEDEPYYRTGTTLK
jgi:prepilin-type N-terminal cleavage/methylation domain-containing protein